MIKTRIQQNTDLYYIALAIVAGAVIVLTVYLYLSSNRTGDQNTPSLLRNTGYLTKPTLLSATPGKNIGSEGASLTYQEATETFEGKRIQFANCYAYPTFITLKNRTQVMLDNRSSERSKISVGGTDYNLGGHEFMVVTVSSPYLPNTVAVSCESEGVPLYNSAQILLQQ